MSTSKVFLNYTDVHDVDEDKMTIACGQGWYWGGNECGALHRLLFNIPTFTQGDVASYA